MKRNSLGSYVALIALLVAPLALRGMDSSTQEEQSNGSGKTILALLGLGGASYGAYHVYNSPELSKSVKDKWDAGKTWVSENKVAAGCGLAALAAAGYLGYRWMTAEPELVVPATPNFQRAAAVAKAQPQASTESKAPARVINQLPEWANRLSDLVKDVCAKEKLSEAATKAKSEKIMSAAQKDPYNLLYDELFIDSLTDSQKLLLARIFTLYREHRLAQTVAVLDKSLKADQDGLKELLQDAMRGGYQTMKAALSELENANYLTEKQAKFVKSELNYYRELEQIDANYRDIYLVPIHAATSKPSQTQPATRR